MPTDTKQQAARPARAALIALCLTAGTPAVAEQAPDPDMDAHSDQMSVITAGKAEAQKDRIESLNKRIDQLNRQVGSKRSELAEQEQRVATLESKERKLREQVETHKMEIRQLRKETHLYIPIRYANTKSKRDAMRDKLREHGLGPTITTDSPNPQGLYPVITGAFLEASDAVDHRRNIHQQFGASQR